MYFFYSLIFCVIEYYPVSFFFFSSRRRHTRFDCDWSSDVCSSDLFTEVGTGVRASVTMYDRGHSSISQMKPDEIEWKKLFAGEGARWLHTGGILTSLSTDSAAVVKTACQAARDAGVIVS